MRIAQRLAALRKARKLSQMQVAAYLEEHGMPLTQKGISKWECGDTMPNAAQFLLLCELYGVRDVLYEFLGTAGEEAALNEQGRARVREYIRLLARDEAFAAEPVCAPEEDPHLTLRAAAAQLKKSGMEELEDEAIEPEAIEPEAHDMPAPGMVFYDLCTGAAGAQKQSLARGMEVPAEADMAVRMGDESMTPLFEKGQTLYVRNCDVLENGAFGFFCYEGVYYVRLYMELAGQAELLSVNPAFAPLRIQDRAKLQILGAVMDGR